MALHVYCPRKSQGALELVRALGANRLRKFDGMQFWNRRDRIVVPPEDTIVCWGNSLPKDMGVRLLNGGPHISKFEELARLTNDGVNAPAAHLLTGNARYTGPSGLDFDGRPSNTWLPRKFGHSGGQDLLERPTRPDYWTRKLDLTDEYRIHVFDNKSIRAGVKVLRDGWRLPAPGELYSPTANIAHPWVRSFEAGWRVKYDGFASTRPLRDLAKSALHALGLTFGAIDIGSGNYPGRTGTYLWVLEVNRAPGIEGNSVGAYVRAINKWLADPNRNTLSGGTTHGLADSQEASGGRGTGGTEYVGNEDDSSDSDSDGDGDCYFGEDDEDCLDDD